MSSKLCFSKSLLYVLFLVIALVMGMFVFQSYSNRNLTLQSRAADETPYCFIGSAPAGYKDLAMCEKCKDTSSCKQGKQCQSKIVVISSGAVTNMGVCVSPVVAAATSTPSPVPVTPSISPVKQQATTPVPDSAIPAVSFEKQCIVEGTIQFTAKTDNGPGAPRTVLPADLRVGVRIREINTTTNEVGAMSGQTFTYYPVNGSNNLFLISGLNAQKTYIAYGFIEKITGDATQGEAVVLANESNIFRVKNCSGEKTLRDGKDTFPVCKMKPVCGDVGTRESSVDFILEPGDFKLSY